VYEKASVIRKGIGSAPRCTGGGMTKRLGFPIQLKARLFLFTAKFLNWLKQPSFCCNGKRNRSVVSPYVEDLHFKCKKDRLVD